MKNKEGDEQNLASKDKAKSTEKTGQDRNTSGHLNVFFKFDDPCLPLYFLDFLYIYIFF